MAADWLRVDGGGCLANAALLVCNYDAAHGGNDYAIRSSRTLGVAHIPHWRGFTWNVSGSGSGKHQNGNCRRDARNATAESPDSIQLADLATQARNSRTQSRKNRRSSASAVQSGDSAARCTPHTSTQSQQCWHTTENCSPSLQHGWSRLIFASGAGAKPPTGSSSRATIEVRIGSLGKTLQQKFLLPPFRSKVPLIRHQPRRRPPASDAHRVVNPQVRNSARGEHGRLVRLRDQVINQNIPYAPQHHESRIRPGGVDARQQSAANPRNRRAVD